MEAPLHEIARKLLSRRFLAVAILCMIVHNFYQWRKIQWQGSASLLCQRRNGATIRGPSGYVVTGHEADCGFFLSSWSGSFVYLHKASEPDRSSNLILLYDGNPPDAVWTDATHVVIRGDLGDDVGRQVVVLGGIHIAYIDAPVVTH